MPEDIISPIKIKIRKKMHNHNNSLASLFVSIVSTLFAWIGINELQTYMAVCA